MNEHFASACDINKVDSFGQYPLSSRILFSTLIENFQANPCIVKSQVSDSIEGGLIGQDYNPFFSFLDLEVSSEILNKSTDISFGKVVGMIHNYMHDLYYNEKGMYEMRVQYFDANLKQLSDYDNLC